MVNFASLFATCSNGLTEKLSFVFDPGPAYRSSLSLFIYEGWDQWSFGGSIYRSLESRQLEGKTMHSHPVLIFYDEKMMYIKPWPFINQTKNDLILREIYFFAFKITSIRSTRAAFYLPVHVSRVGRQKGEGVSTSIVVFCFFDLGWSSKRQSDDCWLVLMSNS